METANITIDFLVQAGLVLLGLWAFVKAVQEMIEAVNKRHDREQKWDDYAKNLDEERDKIYEKYDNRLKEIENKIDLSNESKDAQIQELKAEVLILTKSMSAVMSGLIQQGCNGPVTEAKKNLDEFLMSKL